MSSDGELVGGCLGLIGILIVVAIVITLVAMLFQALVACGALYGAGISLHNYGLSFRQHVRPERRAA